MEPKVEIHLAPVESVAEELRQAISALSDQAILELSHACEVWGETVSDGRQPIGVWNERYDICLIEAAAPSPWALSVYDSGGRKLVIVALLAERKKPSRGEAAQFCASGLGEPMRTLVWY